MSENLQGDFDRVFQQSAGVSENTTQLQREPQPQPQPEPQTEPQPQAQVQAPQQEEQPQKPEPKEGLLTKNIPMSGDKTLDKTANLFIDTALAGVRGIEAAAEGIYGFVDYITGDRLWDWDRDQHSLFGRSKTTIGRLGEGIAQFAVGFIPGLGAASYLGKAAKVGGALSKSKGALKTLASGKLSLSSSTMKKMSKFKTATKVGVRNATAGALSEFLVFKGEEERISNTIARYGGEGNAIVDWLAYDPDKDNNELEERFKTSLEGLIVGEALGLAFVGGKAAVKSMRKMPEKDAALSGIQKTFNTLREKNKKVTESRIAGEEVDEFKAVSDSMGNPDNQISNDEAKAMREMSKRINDKNKTTEYEEISGQKTSDTPIPTAVQKAKETLNNVKKPSVKPVDVEKLNEDQLDEWLRENVGETFPGSSLQSKREAAKDIIEQSKEGGTEHVIRSVENYVVNTVKKLGLYDESNPQSILSGARVLKSVPEMRSLISHVAKLSLKASKEANPKIEDVARFYEETKRVFVNGIEAAGGKKSFVDLNLEPLRGKVEDIRQVRAEADSLYEMINLAAKDIKAKMDNAEEALNRGFVQSGDNQQAMGFEEAMVDVYSAMDRFTAMQEIWADFGTQLSLGLRQRNDLYVTGSSSLGRDIAGQHRELGMDVEQALSNSGKLFRRMNSKGYSDKRVLKDLKKIFKKSGNEGDIGGRLMDANQAGVLSALSRFNLVSRKGLAVSQEWYYNSILGSPTTWAVNLLGSGLVLPLRHIESIAGGVMTGNTALVKANLRAMFDLQSFSESLKYAWRSGVDDEARSISGYTAFKDDRLAAPKGEIYKHNPNGNAFYSAINLLGTIVRHPTRFMMVGDEFFKQMSFRSRIKTSLAVEGYEKGLHRDPGKLAEYINTGFEGMITKDGRFRNEDNVRKEAQLALQAARQSGEQIENPKNFIDNYVYAHFEKNEIKLEDGILYNQKNFDQRQALVESGTNWALMNTFTNEVTNPFFKKTGEVATMSPWLGFLIPFVRTPSNILLFALGRTLPTGAPKALLQARTRAKGLESLGPEALAATKYGEMPEGKRMAEEYLKTLNTENAIEAGEQAGRLAFGVMTMGAFFMNIERIQDRITGSPPKDEGRRKSWAATGKQPFSIKFGDKWHSYQRLDPFATILGIMADIVHGHADIRDKGMSEFGSEEEFEEKQPYMMQISGVIATAFANNTMKKSYIENIGELLDLMEKPTETLGGVAGNVLGGFVPNGLNWTQNIYQEEPAILEARTLMDNMLKRIPEKIRPGEKLMPKRNALGEIIRKGKSTTGSVLKAANPIFSSEISNDIVDMEIENQAVGRLNMKPGVNIGGRKVDFRDYRNANGDTAYDRMQELSGTMKLGPRRLTLRQALRATIESNDYQNLPPITETNKHKDHPRTKELSKLFRMYRSEAKRRTQQEFQELRNDLAKLLQ